MHVKAEATLVTNYTWKHPYHNRKNTDEIGIKRAIKTIITRRCLWRSSKQEVHNVKSMPTPLLQQRPQCNIFRPYENNDHCDDEHKLKRATPTDILQLMDSLQLPIGEDMYVSLLKDSTHSRGILEGAKVHSHIVKRIAKKRSKNKRKNNVKSSYFPVNLANRLLLMYTSCNSLDTAREIFDQMPVRDGSSWATMIFALSYAGEDREALGLFVDMLYSQTHGWLDLASKPTSTLVHLITVVLRSCVQVEELGLGKQLHGVAFKLTMDAMLASPLLQYYTGLILAYCRKSQLQDAFHVFRGIFNGTRHDETREKKDDSIAFSSILTACARKREEQIGRQVHARAIKTGLDFDLYVGTSLVTMYGRSGLVDEARRAFEAACNCSNSVKNKDSACWNAMLSTYMRNGNCIEAIRFLYEMKSAGIQPMESIVSQLRIGRIPN